MRKSTKSKYVVASGLGILLLFLVYVTFRRKIDVDSALFKVICEGGESALNDQSPLEDSSIIIEEWKLCSGELRLDQNDSRLVNYVRKHNLIPPSKEIYDLTPQQPHVDKIWKNLVAKRVLEILTYKREGYFIECGANDGQFLSNTLLMETQYSWTGLLIEGDPRPLEKLIKRHRKAWIANICLSTTSYPVKIAMLRHKEWEAMSFIPKFDVWRRASDYEKFESQCFPLFTILSALNVTTVDYFSLDIEGAELQVLKTFPFESVLVKVFSIEFTGETAGPLEDFMTTKGYVLDQYIEETHTHDQIYVHKSINT